MLCVYFLFLLFACGRVIDVGSEWRTFNNEKSVKDNSRVGASEVSQNRSMYACLVTVFVYLHECVLTCVEALYVVMSINLPYHLICHNKVFQYVFSGIFQ